MEADLIKELKQLQKNINNVGPTLTLWALIELLIAYFKSKGGD